MISCPDDPISDAQDDRIVQTLSELVGAERVGLFMEHYVAKARLFLPGGGPARAMLPWGEIDRLFGKSAIPISQLRAIVNRNGVPSHMYLDPTGTTVRPEVIQSMAGDGASFIISGISRLSPLIAELTRALELELMHRVQANCYLSFGTHSAFHVHSDDHDVIILQIHGSKRWRCHGVVTPYPLKGGHHVKPNPVEWEGVLEPGDVLYIPRGDTHAAVPVDRPSVHLTIGLVESTGIDFFKWLVRKAEDQEVARRNLQRNAPDATRNAREEELKTAIHALVNSASLEAYWNDEDAHRTFHRASTLNFAQRLRQDSRIGSLLRRRIDLKPLEPGEAIVKVQGDAFPLSSLSRRALAVATEHGPLTFASLAEALELDPGNRDLAEALEALALIGIVGFVESGTAF